MGAKHSLLQFVADPKGEFIDVLGVDKKTTTLFSVSPHDYVDPNVIFNIESASETQIDFGNTLMNSILRSIKPSRGV